MSRLPSPNSIVFGGGGDQYEQRKAIARAAKILEPYSKGARAWFEDADEAWVKGTLVQRTDDETIGIGRLVFLRDSPYTSTTAKLIAQTTAVDGNRNGKTNNNAQPSILALDENNDEDSRQARKAANRMSTMRRPATADELKRIVTRGSRLTGGRISSMQKVDNTYVIDIVYAELAEPGADAELLPPLSNPAILDCTPDLTALSYLHEPAVLFNLRKRYEQQQIYTYSGVVLVAMNPFDPVPLYTPKIMAQYARQEPGYEEPHLFAIAENAYKGMVNEQCNQTIIVYGESGSGKTTSAKYIMRYFAQAHHADTNDKQMSTVESQILATNPVFESFGNAKTTRNDNSSRFGKFLEIKFERTHQNIVGGRIRTFLLERSRVAYQPPTERNYHIFYQLLAGASDELRKRLGLEGKHGSWQGFHYTRQGGEDSGEIVGVDDAEDFAVTGASLGMVGINEERRQDIWRTLAGILHLGNVLFSGTESIGSYVDSSSEDEFIMSAELLGVDKNRLRQWLTKRQIVTRHDRILAKVNKAQALVIRDSIAKFVYSRLFDWILGPINASLLPNQVDEQQTLFVGVLDIYGFEHFAHNSFEQFCINYANEKLQQNFNHHVFKLEQEEYKREKLKDWTFIGFQDNQPCIDLIEGKPISILALLDEESRLEQGSDRKFTEKLYAQFDSSKQQNSEALAVVSQYFRKPRFSNTAFTIKHYAHEVTYEGDGFLEKNKDTVPDEILELLRSSGFGFVSDLASTDSSQAGANTASSTNESPRIDGGSVMSSPLLSRAHTPQLLSRNFNNGPTATGGELPKQRRQAPMTLVGVFRKSLSGLMATLAETEMHYIRCIKPNGDKCAWKFGTSMVLSQLRSCGVIETIRISKAGYPSRVPIRTFNDRYAILLQKNGSGGSRPSSHKGHGSNTSLSKVEHALCRQVLAACLPDSGQYQIGQTKVFFRAGQWAIMEKKRSQLFEGSAIVLQSLCRGILVRRSYRKMMVATRRIQLWYRSLMIERQIAYMQRQHAVRVISRCWLAYRAEQKRLEMEGWGTGKIQSLVRGYLARMRVACMRSGQRIDRDHDELRVKQDQQLTSSQFAACNRDSVTMGYHHEMHYDDEEEGEAIQPQQVVPVIAASSNIRRPAPLTHQSKLQHGGSDAVNEALSRLIANPSSTRKNTPYTAGAFERQLPTIEIRRMSNNSQNTEQARRRTAEARASLLAAGVAERTAEAGLPPSNSPYNARTPYKPSYLSGETAISRHHHARADSLTLGDDVYAIINEFSLVADGRYGEVDARSLKRKEVSVVNHSPALSEAYLRNSGNNSYHQQPKLHSEHHSWLQDALYQDDDDEEKGYSHILPSLDRYSHQDQMPSPIPEKAVFASPDLRYLHRLPVVKKRESHSSLPAKPGGRHTAARARAWANKQKDRVRNAFAGNSSSSGPYMDSGRDSAMMESPPPPLPPPSQDRFGQQQSHSRPASNLGGAVAKPYIATAAAVNVSKSYN